MFGCVRAPVGRAAPAKAGAGGRAHIASSLVPAPPSDARTFGCINRFVPSAQVSIDLPWMQGWPSLLAHPPSSLGPPRLLTTPPSQVLLYVPREVREYAPSIDLSALDAAGSQLVAVTGRVVALGKVKHTLRKHGCWFNASLEVGELGGARGATAADDVLPCMPGLGCRETRLAASGASVASDASCVSDAWWTHEPHSRPAGVPKWQIPGIASTRGAACRKPLPK